MLWEMPDCLPFAEEISFGSFVSFDGLGVANDELCVDLNQSQQVVYAAA